MTVIRSVCMALAMFSAIPVPQIEWDEKNTRYILCALPFVGVLCGLAAWGWLALCRVLQFGALLRAAGLAVVPIAVTGGIHLDGFCDVSDALASHAEPEKKRAIMKDPHVGAFAVISAVTYMLMYFGICTEIDISGRIPLLLALICVQERALAALAVIVFPPSSKTGLSAGFRLSADKKRASLILISVAAAASVILIAADPLCGAVIFLCSCACFAVLYFMSKRQFGGMSGDLAGWYIQVCELCSLASILLVQRIMLL